MNKRGARRMKRPQTAAVHGALIAVQVIFGVAQVIGKLGLPSTNPVLFAFMREGAAGPILLGMAAVKERALGTLQRRHTLIFLLAGACLFMNQLCFIVGIKLSNAVLSAAWQPAQPIFTAAIAISLGWERPTWPKLAGISIAFGGAAFMAFYGQDLDSSSGSLWGNLMFFLNDMGTALYVIVSKTLLDTYPPMTVIGVAYCVATVLMCATMVLVTTIRPFLDFVCSDCNGRAWDVPAATVLPLLYWILLSSVVAYLLLTWANKYAESSKVLAYTALQPTTAALLSVILLRSGAVHAGSLELPGYNALGVIGIMAGVGLLIYDTSVAAPDYRAIQEEPAA